MKNINRITFLLIIILLINIAFSRSINPSSYNEKKIEKKITGDQYYLIFVNNTYGEINIFSETKKLKRHESKANDFVFSLLEEIHDIIVDNKDTFENPEVIEEKENQSKLRKRNHEDEKTYSFNDSKFVYPISSVGNSLVLYAYLSSGLVNDVKNIAYVEDVIPDSHSVELYSYYDEQDILEEANWKNLTIREDADLHLSLISQGRYYEDLVSQYDKNYYYPSSAGKGIDIIILDTSFNFEYFEFENTLERDVKCVANFDDGELNDDYEDGRCGFNEERHGNQVSDAAGGINHGAANRANIYGVSVPINKYGKIDDGNLLAGLEYISKNMIRPHKTIVNMSIGKDDHVESPIYIHYKQVMEDITKKGGIVVVASGNDNKERCVSEGFYTIPCSFDSTICVGGIDSRKNIAVGNVYKKASFSNFGQYVDIYGPAFVDTEYIDDDGEIIEKNSKGTSFAAPLTAGVIATLMSEHPEIEFTKDSMLKYLLKDAPRFSYNDIDSYIVNNGKHIVYSSDDTYIGCGISAGNRPCNKWCSLNSKVCSTLQNKKDKCLKSGGILTYDKQYNDKDIPDYVCLTMFTNYDDSINPTNSVCFYGNDKSFCINSEYTIYKECDLSDKDYDYDTCVNKIFDLTFNNGLNWTSNLKSYPYMEKVTHYPEFDQSECENYGGVFIKKDDGSYLCLTKFREVLDYSGNYCIHAITKLVVHDHKDLFCVNDYLSHLEVCDRYSDKGNFSKCYEQILLMSRRKLYYIEPYYSVWFK